MSYTLEDLPNDFWKHILSYIGNTKFQPLVEVSKSFKKRIQEELNLDNCKEYRLSCHEARNYPFYLNKDIFKYALDRNMDCIKKMSNCFLDVFIKENVPNGMMISILESVKDINLNNLTYNFTLLYINFIYEMALRENFEILNYCYTQEWTNIFIIQPQFHVDSNIIFSKDYTKEVNTELEYKLAHKILFYVANSRNMVFVEKCLTTFQGFNQKYLLLGAIYYKNMDLIEYCTTILNIQSTQHDFNCAVYGNNIPYIQRYIENNEINYRDITSIIINDDLESFLLVVEKLKMSNPLFVKHKQNIGNSFISYNEINNQTLFENFIESIVKNKAYKILIYIMENFFHDVSKENIKNLFFEFLNTSFSLDENTMMYERIPNELEKRIICLFIQNAFSNAFENQIKIKYKLIEYVLSFCDINLLNELLKNDLITDHELFIVCTIFIQVDTLTYKYGHSLDLSENDIHNGERSSIYLSPNAHLMKYKDREKKNRETLIDESNDYKKKINEFITTIFNEYKTKYENCIKTIENCYIYSDNSAIVTCSHCSHFISELTRLERSDIDHPISRYFYIPYLGKK